jgi:hypothetical protein
VQSSFIGKIEKAKRYAQEPGRATLLDFTINFKGDNNAHKVRYENSKWHCTCSFFSQAGVCSHIMALQKIMAEMLPPEARSSPYIQIPV